jgi:hypothetical protein
MKIIIIIIIFIAKLYKHIDAFFTDRSKNKESKHSQRMDSIEL